MAYEDDKDSNRPSGTVMPSFLSLATRDGQPQRTPRLAAGLVWCVAGGFVACMVAYIGALMMAFGITAVAKSPGTALRGRWLLAPLCCLAPIVAYGLLGGLGVDVRAVGEVVCALAMSLLVASGKSTLTSCFLVTCAIALVLGAAEVGPVLAAGNDPSKLVTDAVTQAFSGADLEEVVEVRAMRPIIAMVWPLSYFVMAGLAGYVAHCGSRAGLVWALGQQAMPERTPIARLAVPSWAVVALAVSVLAIAGGQALGDGGRILLMAGVNAALVVRFLFAAQGLGVLSWLLASKRVGCLGNVAITVLAVWLEASFFVLSIVGLVDFWADFRHLARGGSADATQDQGK